MVTLLVVVLDILTQDLEMSSSQMGIQPRRTGELHPARKALKSERGAFSAVKSSRFDPGKAACRSRGSVFYQLFYMPRPRPPWGR